MKILLINEYVKMGGAEVQTFRERDLFRSKGHTVTVMTFDNAYPTCENLEWVNIPIKIQNRVVKWVDKLWGTSEIRRKIASAISRVEPDFIHINGIFSAPLDVMECVKDYKTIQTIRDFAAVCPYGTCVDGDYNECNGYTQEKCYRCGHFNVRCFYNHLSLKAFNKKRAENLNAIITPSQALAHKCCVNGIYAKCINNPFDFSKISNVRIKDQNGTKLYLYYGLIAENKGIIQLINAFEVFAKGCDVQLVMIGKVHEPFKEQFEKIKEKKFVNYLGQKDFVEIMRMYHNIYCVVVPSLWIENYPNTVLEALSNKTLVIGSNRGGIPEMIQNENLLFDVLDNEDIVTKLIYTYHMSYDDYERITESGYDRVAENNTLEKYYERLMDLYQSL